MKISIVESIADNLGNKYKFVFQKDNLVRFNFDVYFNDTLVFNDINHTLIYHSIVTALNICCKNNVILMKDRYNFAKSVFEKAGIFASCSECIEWIEKYQVISRDIFGDYRADNCNLVFVVLCRYLNKLDAPAYKEALKSITLWGD